MSFLSYWIVAAFGPRLAAEDAVYGHESAFDYAVLLNSFVTILGTRGVKPTKTARVKDF